MAGRTKIMSFEVYMENVEEGYYVGRNGVEEIACTQDPATYQQYFHIRFENGEVKSFLSTVPHAFTEKSIKEDN